MMRAFSCLAASFVAVPVENVAVEPAVRGASGVVSESPKVTST